MNHAPFAFRTIEDVLADLDECQRTLEGDIADLKRDMEEVKQNFTVVDEELMNIMPLGSIVAWVPKPDRGATNRSEIPVGWTYCDGSPIKEGIWKGLSTPDLNGRNDFLRGGSWSDYLNHEDFANQNLDLKLVKEEENLDHTHPFKVETHDHGHFCKDSGGGIENKVCHVDKLTIEGDTESEKLRLTYSGLSLEQNENYKTADETRPVNTYVIWIIRVQ